MAGKRKGKEDDRYLWPEMLRAIREIQPTWVVGENVGGIISMVQPCDEVEVGGQASLLEEDYFTQKDQEYVVETICSDLEREGYSVQPFLIPACAIGAPHRRDRVWFVANSKGDDNRKQGREHNPKWKTIERRETKVRVESTRHGKVGPFSNTKCKGLEGENREWMDETVEFTKQATADTKRIRLEHNMERGCETEMFGEEGRGGQDCIPAKIQRIKATGERWSTPDTDSDGLNRRNGQYEKHTDQGGEYALNDVEQDAAPDTGLLGQKERQEQPMGVEQLCEEQNAPDTESQQSERVQFEQREFGQQEQGESGGDDSKNDVANSSGCRRGQNNEQQQAEEPKYPRPGWVRFPTQSPVCGRDDGLSDRLVGISFPKWRTESIKAYGNAIVPQVAYEIFKAINKYEQNYGQD
jgi:DNA (cytosine-5)-methyltransferase 1